MLALSALGWVLSDEDHADRLLALTGVAPEELRARIGEREVLCAVLDFVLHHEPDTLACAAALGGEARASGSGAGGLVGTTERCRLGSVR